MEYYKLLDIITDPVQKQVEASNKDGTTSYPWLRLEPGMAYEMPNDPVFRRSVLGLTTECTMELKSMLDSIGASYEVVKPHCHCKQPYIKVRCVEVIEGE